MFLATALTEQEQYFLKISVVISTDPAKRRERIGYSAYTGMETGDLFLADVCSYTLNAEYAITWHRKVLTDPGQVWFSAITCLSSYFQLFRSPDAVFFIVYTLS